MPKGIHDRKPAIERFWNKVDKKGDDECWSWTGVKCDRGYGMFYEKGQHRVLAHRYSLELSLGRKIGDGLYALHSCDNRVCVNPAHLREGTHRENMDDMLERNRSAKGSKVGISKLTEDEVIEIRRLYATGVSQYELAEKFEVVPGHISKIVLRQLWKHI